MKKFAMFIAVVAFFALALPVSADSEKLHLGDEGQLNPKACEKEGPVVINVEEKVKNDVDSGFGGNWAFDNYTRHIKVWQVGEESETSWCATVKYEGKFEAIAGQTGPGGSEVIGEDVKGEMRGGYRATFNGTLKTEPLWPTHGSVGTVDYGCDITGSACTYVSWMGKYFDNVTNFAQPWWGWIYKAEENHGTWLNQINVLPADSGNIF